VAGSQEEDEPAFMRRSLWVHVRPPTGCYTRCCDPVSGGRIGVKLHLAGMVACLAWLFVSPTALWADPASPPAPQVSAVAPVATSPPATQPSAVAPPTVPPPTSPPVESSPVSEPPAAEQGSPVTQGPSPRPTQPATSAGNDQPGNGTTATVPSGSAGAPASSAVPPAGSTGTTLPPTSGDTSTGSAASNIVNIVADPQAASVPAQLACSGHARGTASPFLVSPYAGWASVNSFLDHDNPDYAVDGRIALANGLSADASAGAESDSFPAYWSPKLRQYVNYDGHNGYDFGVSYQPILAAGDGTVMFAGWNSPDPYAGYGQMVLIDHHNGYVTLYGHLSQLEVHKGEKVTAGEEIGISGTTGHSSGPHLHFSVFHNCHVTDPYGWTGQGEDPLHQFDGERAAYLWLPGHEPLILNPPPAWPTYPAGLHVAIPRDVRLSRTSSAVPAADRLLLLDLPVPAAQDASAGVALSRTEASITQEAESLTPYLRELQSAGLVDEFQVIPAAAAVWVRGTAQASQLESLPGVASLSGVQDSDLEAAQAGLAHSVLIQLGQQQAPSLWPVGFRSALHEWRPTLSVLNRQALVEGFALPGDNVVVWLRRRGRIAATATAVGDPDTGGFVTMLHDGNGQPVDIRAGDNVEAQVGGRRAVVTVHRFIIRARSTRIFGRADPYAAVPIALVSPGGQVTRRTVATADAQGRFSIATGGHLVAGTEAVGSATDGAGEEESAAGYVPGMIVDLTASTVRGWTVAHDPTIQVWRAGREALAAPLTPATDGTFYQSLTRAGSAFALHRGDVVSIGSQWHRHRLTVPALQVRLRLHPGSLSIWGEPGLKVRYSLATTSSARTGSLALAGRRVSSLSVRRLSAGSSATVWDRTNTGDLVTVTTQVRSVSVRPGKGVVEAMGAPETGLDVIVLSAAGSRIGGGAASADKNGRIIATLTGLSGGSLKLQPGMRLLLRDAAPSALIQVPRLAGRVSAGTLSLNARPHSALQLRFTGSGHAWTRTLVMPADGTAVVPGTSLARTASRVAVTARGPEGVTFTRSFRLTRTRAACHSAGSSRACSVRHSS
jgi:hypothetical protein